MPTPFPAPPDAEHALRRVARDLPVLLSYLDQDLVYRFANGTYEAWFGRPAHEVEGRTATEVLGEAAVRTLKPHTDAALAGQRVSVEVEVEYASVGRRHVRATYIPDRDETGAVVGFVACVEDITTRKHAEAEQTRLAAERDAALRKLEAVLELLPVGVVIADDPRCEVMRSNPEIRRILGIGEEDNISLSRPDAHRRPAVRMFADGRELRADELPAHRAALTGERTVAAELQIERTDGAVVHVTASAVPLLGPDGARIGSVACYTDVTAMRREAEEARRVEANLRRAEQLQAVGTLAGGVAHEVNNQLSIVLGFGELALRKPGAHPVAAELGHMVSASRRAAAVTRQLLAYSRRQVLAPVVLDLHEVLLAFSPVLVRLLGADKRLVLDLCADDLRILADPAQLEQVLVNLTANARDAMPAGGVLTVSTAVRHDVVEGVDASFAMLAVRDTGTGMSREVQARVFEPFFTTKPVGEGSGLGLPTVYGIVTQSGGRVEIDSAPGAGTTVRVLLPLAGEVQRHTSDSPATAASGRGLVVLAEDEPALRALTIEVLEEAGYTVREAADGEAALALIDALTEPPALLLTDLVMPKANGRAVSARLRERWAVPVLFTSGYAGDDALRRGLMDDGAAFLQKPFTPTELLAAVQRLVGG